MKYITLEESRKRSKYVPAPFDETNLSTDWLEDICDEDTTCASREGKNGTEVLCWINGTMMYVGTCNNRILFTPFTTDDGMISMCKNLDDTIEERVNESVGYIDYLCCRIIRCEYSIMFRFYWELDE